MLIGRAGPDAAKGDDAGDGGHDEIFGLGEPSDVAELEDCEDHYC